MGIALLSLRRPVHAAAIAGQPLDAGAPLAPQQSSGLRYVGIRPSCAARRARASTPCAARGASAARGAHGRCAAQPGQSAGRVVISGRMADVCAELDRLAALEAAGTSARPGQLH